MFITEGKTNTINSISKYNHDHKTTQNTRYPSRYLSQHTSPQLSYSSTWKQRKKSSFVHKKSKDICNTATTEKKWIQAIELYTMNNKLTNYIDDSVNPGISFYKLLLTSDKFEKGHLKINFPETIMMDMQGAYKMIYTDGDGYLRIKVLEKDQYYTLMKKKGISFVQELKDTLKYHKQVDYNENINAPIIIIKTADDHDNCFETQVETFKTFNEKKPKPTRNKIIQRYIYGRNMKSMIFRYCYEKFLLNKPREQQYAYRFQNVHHIFKLNPKNETYQTNKLTSTISLSQKRLNTMEHSKITNKKGLERFKQPTHQLIKFIEKNLHTTVKIIYVDYIIDLFDKPWLINIKYIETFKSKKILTLASDNKYLGITGTCKLCNRVYHKNQLNKLLSTKLIHQFLQHLKKRTKIDEYKNMKFIQQVNVNIKQHKTCHACQCCYQTVMEQLQLINYQKKFAIITNIRPKDQFSFKNVKERPPNLSNYLRQWRLMIYIIDLKNIDPSKFNSKDNLQIGYKLGKGIQAYWKSKLTTETTMNINKVKIHYFFSETEDIQSFLKQTQISITLTKNDQLNIIANGSTGILSNFKSKFPQQCGQRQTSTILLFDAQQKYCQLTIKIGLVCDGIYQTNDINLYRQKSVYFPDSQFTNSNPFPKEWMEIFTLNYQFNLPQHTYETISKSRQQTIAKKLLL